MLLPMPVSDNSRGLPSSGTDYASLANVAASLLPTPTVNSAKNTASPAQLARNSLALDCIEHLLPTPRATDGTKGGPNQRGSSGDLMLPSAVHLLPTPTSMDAKASGGSNPSNITLTDATSRGRTTWGDYAPAITRWETILGRPAPAPTETGPKGSPRLSPRFVEWMMGLPSGHVTDTGIPRNAQLKALGNGVVPQQAAAATRAFLADVGMAAA